MTGALQSHNRMTIESLLNPEFEQNMLDGSTVLEVIRGSPVSSKDICGSSAPPKITLWSCLKVTHGSPALFEVACWSLTPPGVIYFKN